MPWDVLIPFATPLGITLVVVLHTMRHQSRMHASLERITDRYAESLEKQSKAITQMAERMRHMEHVCPMVVSRNVED